MNEFRHRQQKLLPGLAMAGKRLRRHDPSADGGLDSGARA